MRTCTSLRNVGPLTILVTILRKLAITAVAVVAYSVAILPVVEFFFLGSVVSAVDADVIKISCYDS